MPASLARLGDVAVGDQRVDRRRPSPDRPATRVASGVAEGSGSSSPPSVTSSSTSPVDAAGRRFGAAAVPATRTAQAPRVATARAARGRATPPSSRRPSPHAARRGPRDGGHSSSAPLSVAVTLAAGAAGGVSAAPRSPPSDRPGTPGRTIAANPPARTRPSTRSECSSAGPPTLTVTAPSNAPSRRSTHEPEPAPDSIGSAG